MGCSIWKFSNKTIAQVPEMYAMFGHEFLDEILPPWFFEIRLFEIYLGEWVAVLAIGLIAYLVAVGLTAPMYYWMRKKEPPVYTQLLKFFQKPFRFLILIIVANQLLSMLHLSLVIQALHQAKTITFVIVTWFAIRVIDFGFVRFSLRMKKKGQTGMAVFLPSLGNVLKVVLALAVLIFWLDNIGVKVTALVAGLGIGGLAVALAAQKSLENVIGAITLYTSRPVKVGDFCRFGDSYGTVEEIGLRATKVRTHDSTVLMCPMRNSPAFNWKIFLCGNTCGITLKSACGMERLPISFGMFWSKFVKCFIPIPRCLRLQPESVLKDLGNIL